MQPKSYSWVVYQIRHAPAELIGFVDAPDADAAIKQAIKEYNVPEQQRDRLLALRRA